MRASRSWCATGAFQTSRASSRTERTCRKSGAAGWPAVWVAVFGIVLAAFAGKFIGGFVGALGSERRVRVLVGLSMVPRGEVTMVIAGLAFAQGHLSHHIFVTLLAVAILAAIIAPVLMTPLARRLAGSGR